MTYQSLIIHVKENCAKNTATSGLHSPTYMTLSLSVKMENYYNARDKRNELNSSRNPAYLGDGTSSVSENDRTADSPGRDAPDSGNPQTANRQPRYSDGFTMIPPNESRRSKMKMVAQKEEEDLQRWKEANRTTVVQLNPQKLGGDVTLTEARQKQFTDLHTSKLQKKLRKEELDKRRRQEEEEKLQKMKAERREMAERLEERRQLEEQRRREQLRQDQLRKTESFLQRFETRATGPQASSSATHVSSGIQPVGSRKREESKSMREVQLEHRRVNSAFLDKLEGLGRDERATKQEDIREAVHPCFASKNSRNLTSNTPKQQPPNDHLDPDPEESGSNWTEEAEPDYDWALMKLINSFPDFSRTFLEDILDQCSGDYEQAYTLLMSTLS